MKDKQIGQTSAWDVGFRPVEWVVENQTAVDCLAPLCNHPAEMRKTWERWFRVFLEKFPERSAVAPDAGLHRPTLQNESPPFIDKGAYYSLGS
jgi:hypothetical protein